MQTAMGMMLPKLKDSTATALLALSALFLVPGVLIMSPDGRLFFLALAGFVSAIAAIFAPSWKKRLVAGIALVIAFVMAIQAWPEHKTHTDAHTKHTTRPAGQNR